MLVPTDPVPIKWVLSTTTFFVGYLALRPMLSLNWVATGRPRTVNIQASSWQSDCSNAQLNVLYHH